MSLLERLSRVDASSLSDADKSLRVMSHDLRPVSPKGAGRRMAGRAVTADAQGDLVSVLVALERCGPGDVLVVAAGSDECAVAGELFATEAIRRGVAGIVVDGLVRDTPVVAGLPLPVFARGATPKAFPAVAAPVVQVPVVCGGVDVHPGEYLLGDDDGIVVASEDELAAAIGAAEAIQAREADWRAQIEGGRSLFDLFTIPGRPPGAS